MKIRCTAALLLIASLSFLAGCSKKEDPTKTPLEPEVAETTGSLTADSNRVTEAVAAVKESFSMDIDMDKAIADLKAEAARMDLESLTQVASKYKAVLAEKQAEMKTLMDKLAAVPMAEKMGTEAKELTTEIKTLTDSVAPLKERISVYLEAIKAKGGDIKALML